MAGTATQVHQTAFGEHDDALAVGENNVVDLGLDLFPLVFFHARHVDFVVEMTDVANDRLVFHFRHVIMGDDVVVARRGDKNVRLVGGIIHGDDAITFHRCLQRADRVDFRHPHLRRQGPQRLGRAFTHVAVTGDHRHFARDHDIRRALDAVYQGFAAAVEVVELGFRHRVVDVDRRESELALFMHLIKAMHAGSGFLRHAFDRGQALGIPAGMGGKFFLNSGVEECFFLATGFSDHGGIFFRPGAKV